MNKTVKVSEDRLFCQHAMAKQTIVSWHGQRARVIRLDDEHCFFKLVGPTGANTGQPQKARYPEITEWMEPMVAPTSCGSLIKESETLLRDELVDAVENANDEVTSIQRILETSETWTDRTDGQTRTVPTKFFKPEFRSAEGWAILDANNKKVWRGGPYKWSQIEAYTEALIYASQARCDNAVQKMQADGMSNLRRLTKCQIMMLSADPEYWKQVFAVKPPQYITPGGPQRLILPDFGRVTTEMIQQAEDQLNKLKAKFEIQMKIDAMNVEIRKQQEELAKLK